MILQDFTTKETIQKVYHYCLSRTQSHWLAEDITQETIIKVWKMKQENPNQTVSNSFLYTIAKNLHIDAIRKNREYLFHEEEHGAVHHDFSELDEMIGILFASLPLKKAMLITLKDVFRYTSLEISQMLRVREASIKTALHRARKDLQSQEVLKVKVDSTNSNKQMVNRLIDAMKKHQAKDIFYYYRLLEAANYSVMCVSQWGGKSIHVTDPDGNVLEVVC